MLGNISGLEKIYIMCGYTDMLKSIDGHCAIIENQLKMNPSSSALFLFCGRIRDRIKALFREPDDFVLSYKRLSVHGGYQWPRKQSEVWDLSWREFDWLMSGIDIDQQKPVRNTRMDKAVNYVLNRRDTAETYLEDEHCSFTNSLSENAIRPFAVGRIKWLFSSSVYGTNASAVISQWLKWPKRTD